jgi:hypothetical protein
MKSDEPIYSIVQVARLLSVRDRFALELFEGEVGVLPVDISHRFCNSKRRAALFDRRIPSSVLERVRTEKQDLVQAGAAALRDPAAPLRARAEQQQRDRAALLARSESDLPIESAEGEWFYSFVQIARMIKTNVSHAVWLLRDVAGVLPATEKAMRLIEPRVPLPVFYAWQRARSSEGAAALRDLDGKSAPAGRGAPAPPDLKNSSPQEMTEKCCSLNEISRCWGITPDEARELFAGEQGVLEMAAPELFLKHFATNDRFRRFVELTQQRIPEHVFERVQRKLSHEGSAERVR